MTVDKLKQRIKPEGSDGDGGPQLLVLGGGHVGHSVAESLVTDGTVTFVDESDAVCDRAENDGIETHCGKPADAETLADVDAADADAAIVATETDTETFLAAQLLRTRFGVDTVVAMADDPELADHMGDRIDVVVTAPPILAQELTSAYQRVAVPAERW